MKVVWYQGCNTRNTHQHIRRVHLLLIMRVHGLDLNAYELCTLLTKGGYRYCSHCTAPIEGPPGHCNSKAKGHMAVVRRRSTAMIACWNSPVKAKSVLYYRTQPSFLDLLTLHLPTRLYPLFSLPWATAVKNHRRQTAAGEALVGTWQTGAATHDRQTPQPMTNRRRANDGRTRQPMTDRPPMGGCRTHDGRTPCS